MFGDLRHARLVDYLDAGGTDLDDFGLGETVYRWPDGSYRREPYPGDPGSSTGEGEGGARVTIDRYGSVLEGVPTWAMIGLLLGLFWLVSRG